MSRRAAQMSKLGLFVQSFPTVLGCDAAGVVVALGPGTTGVAPGDRVAAFSNLGHAGGGAFAGAGCGVRGAGCGAGCGVRGGPVWGARWLTVSQTDCLIHRLVFAEYAVFEADMLLRVPPGMTFEAAATLPVGLFTAALGLSEICGAGLRPMGRCVWGNLMWFDGGCGPWAGVLGKI